VGFINGEVMWNLILVIEEGKDNFEKVRKEEGLGD